MLPLSNVSRMLIAGTLFIGAAAGAAKSQTPQEPQAQSQTQMQASEAPATPSSPDSAEMQPDAGAQTPPIPAPTSDVVDPSSDAGAAEEPPAQTDAAAPDASNTGTEQQNASSTDSDQATAPESLARSEPATLPEAGADWPFYGGGPGATRYSPLDQITPDNVSKLKRAFVYRTGDMPTKETRRKYAPENTPLKIGGTLYMCTAMNKMVAFDAATGEEKWRYDPKVSPDAIPYGATCRGVSAYTNPEAAEGDACATRIIEGTLDARLIAVDAKTGKPCADFGENGSVDLWAGIGKKVPGWYSVTAPPAIVRGIVVTGAQVKDGQAEDAPSGVIRGYDAITGELAWAWDLGNPELTGMPPEGETYTRGTPNMWTAPVGDEDLGYVYLPLGNSAVDYYGGDRSDAENEYATSLVALDVTTGKPVWHFQTVHYDLWDYDLGSQPTLVDVPVGSKKVPAVILPSKQGDIYVLDRKTGDSLFPVKAMKAPKGGVETSSLSDTQPVSGYHVLPRERLSEKDMWGFSPIDQLWCRIQFRKAAYDGPYTPPTVGQHWIEYPGYNGGSDWGSIAVDPKRGVIIANYNHVPNHNRLLTRDEANERNLRPIYEDQEQSSGSNAEGDGDPQTGSPYAIEVNAGWRVPFTGVPCTKPPYGGIQAIDLATGKTLWNEPLGTARRNGPFGIHSMLPLQIGTPNNGGPVVTAGGLVFIGAATDNLFRAIDIKTGKVVWSDVLPAGGQANPIVYEQNGREYVMIMAGGHHFMETPIGDYVIAYALPKGD